MSPEGIGTTSAVAARAGAIFASALGMKPFRRLLVPTDFSAPARAAREMALTMAQHFEAEVVLLHVVEPQFVAYAGMPFMPIVDLASEVEQAARVALRNEEAALEHARVIVRSTLRHGAAWREILAEASASDVGLIVMSTHGHTGLAHALMGSTAEKIVRMAPIPVLTVHGDTAVP